MEAQERIIFPLDFDNLEEALHWVKKLSPYVGVFKIGLELFVKEGPRAIEAVKEKGGSKIFLDLKLHDIPNTIIGAVKAACSYKIDFLTIHILSGFRSLKEAAKVVSKEVNLIGVTILTSLDKADLLELGFNGELLYKTEDLVLKLAALAKKAGLQGVVASAKEVSIVKKHYPELLTIVPGIRWEEEIRDDQLRTATPYEAIKLGADYIVIGRPIRYSSNPEETCLKIQEEIKSALAKKDD